MRGRGRAPSFHPHNYGCGTSSRRAVPSVSCAVCDVVQQGCPAQPQVVCHAGDVVHDLQRVIEIVLVAAPLDGLHALQRDEFGEDELQQSAAVQLDEAFRGDGREQDFVQLFGDTFARDDADAFFVAHEGLERFVVDVEIQLRGEAHAAHHAQGVVAEGDVGSSGVRMVFSFMSASPSKGSTSFAVACPVEADGQGIDGEVASVLVVLQRAVFDDGLARVVRIGFAACAHELHFERAALHLGRAEVAKHRHMRLLAQFLPECLGHRDAAAHDDDVDVLRGTFEEEVAHVSAHGVALQSQLVGRLGDFVKMGLSNRSMRSCCVSSIIVFPYS